MRHGESELGRLSLGRARLYVRLCTRHRLRRYDDLISDGISSGSKYKCTNARASLCASRVVY